MRGGLGGTNRASCAQRGGGGGGEDSEDGGLRGQQKNRSVGKFAHACGGPVGRWGTGFRGPQGCGKVVGRWGGSWGAKREKKAHGGSGGGVEAARPRHDPINRSVGKLGWATCPAIGGGHKLGTRVRAPGTKATPGPRSRRAYPPTEGLYPKQPTSLKPPAVITAVFTSASLRQLAHLRT
jgi:hypothetical protein